MNQNCKQNILPQQGSRIILEKIIICPDLEQQWFEALGQFAGMLRCQHGFRHLVHISEEEGFVNSAGELVISAKVSTETLQMAIPPRTWGWKALNEENSGQ